MDKITYASLGSLGEEFHQAFDAALKQVRGKLGDTHPMFIAGKPKQAKDGTFADAAPADARTLLGNFQRGNRDETRKAIAAARAAFPAWRGLGWRQRAALLRLAAGLMTRRQFEFAALLSLEVGKNRFEAIAEVSEAIDLILRSEEHTSELQSQSNLVCRLLLEKKKEDRRRRTMGRRSAGVDTVQARGG